MIYKFYLNDLFFGNIDRKTRSAIDSVPEREIRQL